MSAKDELAAELRRMRDEAPGKPTLEQLAEKDPDLKVSTLSNWLNGNSVPADPVKFARLVHLLTGAAPTQALRMLRKQADAESDQRRGRSRGTSVAPLSRAGSGSAGDPSDRKWLPRIHAVQYVNIDRLNELLRISGHSVRRRGALDEGMMPLLRLTQDVIEDLDKVHVETERLTPDFSLYSLEAGDLLVFDRWVFTRNGPRPGDRSATLSGDLDVDPLIYFKRDGVRVVMPIEPAFVTTSSAYTDFSAGGVRLSGLCRIKRRISPTDAPHLRTKPKKQLIASPLILGITNPAKSDPDLAPLPPRWDPRYRAWEAKQKKKQEKTAARSAPD